MNTFQFLKILAIATGAGLAGCSDNKPDSDAAGNAKPRDSSSSSSSSSSTSSSNSSSTSSSSSSSSSSSGDIHIVKPLDRLSAGLLPYVNGKVWDGGSSRGEQIRNGLFETVYSAIDVGSDVVLHSSQVYSNQGTGFLRVDFSFSADDYFTGGQAVDRSSLAHDQEQIAVNHSYSGGVFLPSFTARTGKFIYEIPIAVDKVAVEIHIVPLQDEIYTDVPFSLKIENKDTINTTFNRSNQHPLPPAQGFVFTDVVITDGNLTLEFDLPVEHFGVSAIFVTDAEIAGQLLDCDEYGACQ